MENLNFTEENWTPEEEVLESLTEGKVLEIDDECFVIRPKLGTGANAFLGKVFDIGKKIPIPKVHFRTASDLSYVVDFKPAIKGLDEEITIAFEDLNEVQADCKVLFEFLDLGINVVRVDTKTNEMVVTVSTKFYPSKWKDGDEESDYDVYSDIVNVVNGIENDLINDNALRRYEGRLSEESKYDTENVIPLDLKPGMYFAKSTPKGDIGTLNIVDFDGNPIFKLTNDGEVRTIEVKGFHFEICSLYKFKEGNLDTLRDIRDAIEYARDIITEGPIFYWDPNYDYTYASK